MRPIGLFFIFSFHIFHTREAGGSREEPVVTHAGSVLEKQWAAERSQVLDMMDAPHTCPLVLKWRLTCQGHSPISASFPPTIRLCLYGRIPQSTTKYDNKTVNRNSMTENCTKLLIKCLNNTIHHK